MPFRKKKTSFGPFAILGVFVAVVLLGLGVGGWYAAHVMRGGSEPQAAPTSGAYRSEAADIARPFFSQALVMAQADIAAADPEFAGLVAKTQERLLRLRVPSEEKDTHVGIVLLLDQWKRALAGGGDKAQLLAQTKAFVEQHPYFAP